MPTFIAALFTIGLTVTCGFVFVHYQDREARSAILWGLAAWLCAGIVLAAVGWEKFVPVPAEVQALDPPSAETETTAIGRAWVSIKAVAYTRPLVVGQPVFIQTEAVNSGRTPALKVRFLSGAGIAERLGPDPDLPVQILNNEAVSVATMAPGTPLTNTVQLLQPLSAIEFSRLQNGEMRLFTFGVIEYDDVFGAHHRTTFCFSTFPKDIVKDMTACPKWNTAD